MMHIETICSGCKSKVKAKVHLAGKTVQCPKCASQITIPIPLREVEPATEPPKKTAIPPATEKQKDYARTLGVNFSEDIDRKAISSLIDQALSAQDDTRYQRLDELQNRESKIRDELKQEIIAELDADDSRLSIATPDQMVEALQDRPMGAILVTFDPDVDPNNLTGERLIINYTDKVIGMETVKSIISGLFVMLNRQE